MALDPSLWIRHWVVQIELTLVVVVVVAAAIIIGLFDFNYY